ncbi:hypothetical protein AMATHDRAFT_93747, partial [Amanita thiersii Skay4041]
GHCLDLVRKYDKDMCDVWKEEIDKLLIFVSWPFAAMTAFAVDSYHSLQEDYAATSAQLLVQILPKLQTGIESTNATSDVPTLITPPSFTPISSSKRINIFWFLSLTLSLSTVLLGISCLQWLREYQRVAGTSSHQAAIGMRQMRYEGFFAWKVPSILSAPPL